MSETNKESLAIAILKSGRSYGEAANISGLNIEEVMAVWKESLKK